MSRIEKVEFTNMCMICNDNKVVVIDRQKKDWAGITFHSQERQQIGWDDSSQTSF